MRNVDCYRKGSPDEGQAPPSTVEVYWLFEQPEVYIATGKLENRSLVLSYPAFEVSKIEK
jgi:hypothetical protein